MASKTQVNLRTMTREECLEALKDIASRHKEATSSRAALRGLPTEKRLNNYAAALDADREARAITAVDHKRARRLVEQVRFLSRIGTATAAARLGLSSDQFRRLAERIGLEPVDHYRNPHYRSGPSCPLWSKEAIERLVGSEEVASSRDLAQKMAQGKQEAPQKRQAALESKYSQDWREALPAAAEALFSLNRYAKWPSCDREHREEIYDLKNGLVRLLHSLGLATRIGIHSVDQPGLRCNRCRGNGKPSRCLDDGHNDQDDDADEDNGTDEVCGKCFGTGWYRSPGTLEFVVFTFAIGDKTYCWHQPEELVTWDVVKTEEADTTWKPAEEPKPINLNRAKFASAKSLIQFVLDRARAGG